MQVLAVVGGDPPLAETADRLDGRVAVVRSDDASERDESRLLPTDEFRLHADGTWHGTASGEGLKRLLDRLAPDHDYALIAGATRLRLPTVVVGDATPAGDDTTAEPRDTTTGTENTAASPADTTADADDETARPDDETASPDDETASPDDETADSGHTPDVAGEVVHRADDAVTAETLAATVRDVSPYVTLETLVAEAKRAAGEEFAGAIATFTGRVRARDGPDDTRTTHLAFEKYEGVAADRLTRIERELTDRDGVYDVRTHHRTGVIEAGEDIVFVVVLAGHREEAFRTVSDGIDRLKTEVPLFKKEVTTEDAFWRHERDS